MNVKKLNEYKKKNNLTNSQIAEITGITLSNIDKIMSGSNSNPKLNTIAAICKALCCSLDDIIDDNFECYQGFSEKYQKIDDNASLSLTPHEIKVIHAYKAQETSVQIAICKIFDIDHPVTEIPSSESTPTITVAADGRIIEAYGMDRITYDQLVNAMAKIIMDCYISQKHKT